VWCEEFEHEGEAIIISAVGARCGKAFKANGKWSAIANTNITRAEPTLLEFDFAYLILNNEEFWVRGGSAQPFVKFPPSLSRHFALPPLAEQRRIVAKVDELMALCDELEQRQQARQHARAHLTQSAYHHLTAAKDPTDFRHRFNFILHKASFILDDVPQLRQAILQLAVQGRLFTKGERRAANGFDEMPDGWRSVKLGEVAEHRLGKMLDQQKNSGTPRPYLRNTNVHWFRFELDSIKELRLEDTELETYTLRKGDVLICEGGHGIGRTAVWSGEIPEMVFQKALHRVRPGKQLDSHFFAFCMKVYADTGILENYYTGAGIPHFTGQSLAKLSFPLPPLAEQKRIVARVEELLRWCDMLEAQLHQTRTLGAHLLDSFVERMKEEG
jgi:type I restriction enzyme S subunit